MASFKVSETALLSCQWDFFIPYQNWLLSKRKIRT